MQSWATGRTRPADGFERFGSAQGLSSQRVWALHDDAEGTLWIGTDRGLNVLREGRISSLSTTNGQNSYPPALRLQDGRIAFATMGGVVLFDPDAPPDLTQGQSAAKSADDAFVPSAGRGRDRFSLRDGCGGSC